VDLKRHDLRPEAASRLFESGGAIAEVAAVTGHKRWQTRQINTHIDPGNPVRKYREQSSRVDS